MHVYIRLHKSCRKNVHVHASCPSLRSILLAVLGLSVEVPGFSETNKLLGARYRPESGICIMQAGHLNASTISL